MEPVIRYLDNRGDIYIQDPNNGESLLINIPPLTEERRVELTKLAKSESESAKVSIRNSRKDGLLQLFPKQLLHPGRTTKQPSAVSRQIRRVIGEPPGESK